MSDIYNEAKEKAEEKLREEKPEAKEEYTERLLTKSGLPKQVITDIFLESLKNAGDKKIVEQLIEERLNFLKIDKTAFMETLKKEYLKAIEEDNKSEKNKPDKESYMDAIE
jgi:hypothetical protein